MIIHGSVPDIFLTSTILPILKNKNGNVTDSANYRGIASVFGKIFDHVILEKYRDRLCTSELRFGFKRTSSTHACTLLLKEVLSYYANNQSSVYCTFLDVSKAFDRVQYCTLFRLLLRRNIFTCIVSLINSMQLGSPN